MISIKSLGRLKRKKKGHKLFQWGEENEGHVERVTLKPVIPCVKWTASRDLLYDAGN